MVSTVTTSTITILTTLPITESLALVGIFVLLGLLVQKELTSASGDKRWYNLSRIVNVGILPLLIAFVLIVMFKVIEVIN